MKKLMMACVLVAAPLAAQDFEAGVFLGQQSLDSVTISGNKIEPKAKFVAGARVGYSLLDLGPALLQVTAGYQPKTSSEVEVNGHTVSGSKYEHQHYSVGAMFNFKAFVAVGAGVEYRFEKLEASGAGAPSGLDTTYNRPWARANIGVAFPTPLVKPFVGLEVALPLLTKSVDGSTSASVSDRLKSIAPKFQVGLYAGIRF